ncbi:hypothetical protein ACFE04_002506 [Oxalis oulophora]
MSLIGNAIKSKFATRALTSPNALPFLRRDLPKRFSTESEQRQQHDSTVDSFLQTPKTGAVYGKLTGTAKYTLKSDIVNLLDGSNLTTDDVKVIYNQSFSPAAMMVQFPSLNAFDEAFKMINRKARIFRLERVDRSFWDQQISYNGRAVLLRGLQRSTLAEDVERFFSGWDYDSSSIEFNNVRPNSGQIGKMAMVRFPSSTQAMSAFIKKNRDFLLNTQISLQERLNSTQMKENASNYTRPNESRNQNQQRSHQISCVAYAGETIYPTMRDVDGNLALADMEALLYIMVILISHQTMDMDSSEEMHGGIELLNEILHTNLEVEINLTTSYTTSLLL